MCTQSAKALETEKACGADGACDDGRQKSATTHQSIDSATTDEIIFVNELSDLKKVESELVQLTVWRQANVPEFVTTLSDPSIAAADLPTFEDILLPGEVVQAMKSRLWCPYKLRSQKRRPLTEDGIDELVHHVDRLVSVFAEICKESGFLDDELEFVNVKLEVTSDDGCKYWHQDSVPLRMVATYRGPCTEWVPPAFSKATLGRHRFNSKHSQSLSHKDVALFKGRGEAEPDDLYGQPGIVHRSPRNSTHRLVLVLDIPQEGLHY